TSTSKYKALLRGVSDDNRLRGTLQFAGAARTARYSGRVFQPQNLPSRGLLPEEDIEFGIEALKADCADQLFPDVMKLTSSTIRGSIIAPQGKKLVIADLSNIEGRLVAWLSGEEWKLQAFTDFDNGTGADLYKLAASKAYNVLVDQVTKEQRSHGKVIELACGYAGGAGAVLTFAQAYGIDLDDLAVKIKQNAPEDAWQEAVEFREWMEKQKRNLLGLAPDTFIACDTLKRVWRRSNPAVVDYWEELENGVRGAIDNPGKKFVLRRVTAIRTGAWLRLILPSGRALCYPSPKIDEEGRISYLGVDQYTKKWKRIPTFSGKLIENLAQAIGRDVMIAALPEAEKRGYETILTVHDELVTEAPDTPEFSADMLSAIMSRDLPWSEGLPLAAAGFESCRYKKG
ncbi:MAG TPA: DNA polymerase, partial [Burkholderiales bacterium]|nr:DNA polymerase [Burkholderiales bacterium]